MYRNHCGWWCDLLRVKVAGTVLFWPGHACPCKPHGGTALSPFSRRMNTLHQNTIWMDKASPVQTVQHSEQTLKTALISKNPVLVSQSEKWEAGERRLMNSLPAIHWSLWTHYFAFTIKLDHFLSRGSPRLWTVFQWSLKKDTLSRKTVH